MNIPEHWRRSVLVEWLLLTVFLSALTVLAARDQWLWRVDLALYDAGMALWRRPPPPDIVIVAIDDASLEAIGRWPWRRAVHAALLERLGEARAVGLDLILSEPDERDPLADQVLREALAANRRTVLPVMMATTPGGALRENTPHPALAGAAASLGHIHLELDADGIGRSVYLREGLGAPRWPHFALALLDIAEPGRLWENRGENRGQPAGQLPGQRNPEASWDPTAWVRDYWLHIPFAGPPGHFAQVSYAEALRGDLPPHFFRDKLVLVGATAAGLGDAYPVPVSGLSRAMPGVEITANILDSLRRGIAIRPFTGTAHALFSVVPVLLVLVAYLWLAPRHAVLLTGTLVVLVLAAAFLLLGTGHVWFAPSATILLLLLCYPLWSWRRLEAAQRFLDEEIKLLDPGAEQSPGPSRKAVLWAVDSVERRIQAVRAAVARLRRAERDRREMLDFVAHDLRSPQASIIALMAAPQTNPESVADTFGRIEKHARNTLALADAFVQLAHAESHDTSQFGPVDIAAVLHEAIDGAWDMADHKQLALVRGIGPDEVLVRGDRGLLLRALGNLLSNAVKHSPEHGTISVGLEVAGGMALCSITDQGRGIAADDLPGLFERFRRVQSPDQPATEGVGLGLAFVKTVAVKHGGRVGVKSEPGKGARFELLIPVLKSAA